MYRANRKYKMLEQHCGQNGQTVRKERLERKMGKRRETKSYMKYTEKIDNVRNYIGYVIKL